jgi:hypothetical protein
MRANDGTRSGGEILIDQLVLLPVGTGAATG